MRASLFVLLLGAAAISVVSSAGCDGDDRTCAAWEQWKVAHDRSYPTEDEESRRFLAFVDNLAEIERLNAENPEASFGTNQFSDLTADEFRGAYLNFDSSRPEEAAPTEPEDPEDHRRALPASFTTKYVTPVKNQGQCGSCWAFTTVAVVEGAWLKAGRGVADFSEQQLVNCEKTLPSTCSGGHWVPALKLVKAKGIALEKTYPYKAKNMACGKNWAAVGKISSYSTFSNSESALKSKISSYGPVAIAIDARTLQSYKSGIVGNKGCTKQINHAVTAVGWGASGSTKYILIKNSWGTGWGAKGYFKMASGACMMYNWAAAYAVAPKAAKEEMTGKAVEAGSSVEGNETFSESSMCVPQNNCGERVCGMAHDGCGEMELCGRCEEMSTCNADGKCVSSGLGADDWEQFKPANVDSTAGFKFEDNKVSIGATSEEHRAKWVPSSEWTSASWSKFSAEIAATQGTVGLGMRLGQEGGETDGVFVKLSISGSIVTPSLCTVKKGTQKCTILRSRMPWYTAKPNAVYLTVSEVDNRTPMLKIEVTINKLPLVDHVAHTVLASSFRKVGRAFILADGKGDKVFANFQMKTRTSMRVFLDQVCMALPEFRSRLAYALGVRADAIDKLESALHCPDPLPETANVTAAKRQDEEPSMEELPVFGGFSFDLADSAAFPTLVGARKRDLPAFVSSTVLADSVVSMANEGVLAQVGIAASSVSVVAPAVAQGVVLVALSTSALSAGAVAAIVVGSVLAAAAVVGAATTAVVVGVRKSRKAGPVLLPSSSPATEVKMSPVKGGVDVMNHPEDNHTSISARGVPTPQFEVRAPVN